MRGEEAKKKAGMEEVERATGEMWEEYQHIVPICDSQKKLDNF